MHIGTAHVWPCLTDMRVGALVTVLQEKEDWINAVGRAIVKHSRRWAAGRVAITCCLPQAPRQRWHLSVLHSAAFRACISCWHAA
jgi:hypothetical protein